MTGSQPDNAVTIDDLHFFQVWYEADSADSTGACTPDDAVDSNDLLAFLAHFEGGC